MVLCVTEWVFILAKSGVRFQLSLYIFEENHFGQVIYLSFNFFSFLKSLLNLLRYCFCFMFWFFGCEACGILAPWQGIEPAPPALEGEVLTTEPAGKSLARSFRVELWGLFCLCTYRNVKLFSEENPGPSRRYCLAKEVGHLCTSPAAAGQCLEILGLVSLVVCVFFQLCRNVAAGYICFSFTAHSLYSPNHRHHRHNPHHHP